MTEVLAQYAYAGFVGDAFASTGGQISCGTCSSCLAPAEVAVVSIRRVEGTSDPSDMAAVLAIVCPVCVTMATLVLKFGPEASVDEIAIWQHVSPVHPAAAVSDSVRRSPAADGHSSAATVPDRNTGAVGRSRGAQAPVPTSRGFKPANIATSAVGFADRGGQV